MIPVLGKYLDHQSNQFFHSLGSLLLRRPMRVVVLSLAILVMSSADLYLTLLYVTQVGMNEMNPLARAMMEYQSPIVLAIWKAGTVGLSVGILFIIRKQRSAELGAWVGCLVMGWLMFHWAGFIHASRHMNIEVAVGDPDHPSWIIMSTPAQGIDGVFAEVID